MSDEQRDEGTVRLSIEGPVANVTFDRPASRNAMTWRMYEEFNAAMGTIAADPDVRVCVLRGAGGESFVAGTDISQFLDFSSGKDGIAYNERVDRSFALLDELKVPTIAVITGVAAGGGLAFAAVCDLRIVSDDSRFGIPVSRTLANLPAMPNITRLVTLVGPAHAKEMLFTARLWGAEEALAKGLVSEVHPRDRIEERVSELCELLVSRAPLTMWGVKETVRRIYEATIPAGADLIEHVYGSDDFREGMQAFLEKRPPVFRNR